MKQIVGHLQGRTWNPARARALVADPFALRFDTDGGAWTQVRQHGHVLGAPPERSNASHWVRRALAASCATGGEAERHSGARTPLRPLSPRIGARIRVKTNGKHRSNMLGAPPERIDVRRWWR